MSKKNTLENKPMTIGARLTTALCVAGLLASAATPSLAAARKAAAPAPAAKPQINWVKSIPLDLAPFTLVGATTRAGLLPNPLRDRFGFTAHLEYYEPEELEQVVGRSAAMLEIELPAQARAEIARRSRGTPRIANRLLRRVRDFCAVEGDGKLTLDLAKAALKLEGIDEKGLDEQDRQFLRTLITVYDGGPAGIEAIAATMGDEVDTLVDVIEPFLLQTTFVTRTRQGRRATKLAYDHLGLQYVPPQDLGLPAEDETPLFNPAQQGPRPAAKDDRKSAPGPSPRKPRS